MFVGYPDPETVLSLISALNKLYSIDASVDNLKEQVKKMHQEMNKIMDHYRNLKEEKTKDTDRIFLIKGGGGALLREKIIARSSRAVCIIADSSKYNPSGIGRYPLPVEISPFLPETTLKELQKLGARCSLRGEGKFITDNGNLIVDCEFGTIANPEMTESRIKNIPGVLEVGLFTSINCEVYMGTKDGVRIFRR